MKQNHFCDICVNFVEIFSKVPSLEPNNWSNPTLQQTQCNVTITSASTNSSSTKLLISGDRLQAVIRAHGGHIEQLFTWLSASFWLLYEVVIGHTDTHIALVFCHCDIMMLGVLWLCCNISNELLTYKFSLGFSMCTTEFQFTGYVICASKRMLQY